MSGRLQDESPNGTAFACTPREQVQRADDVHLMRAPLIHVERVDARHRVHDGVDADGSHELADQGVADVELEVISAAEVVTRLAGVDADDFGDAWVVAQPLHEQSSPP